MTEAPSSKNSSQPIYEQLKRDIANGLLAPGTALRQHEIGQRFGVSKVPVREALLKLEAERYVEFRKNKGATVREVSDDEILDLIDIRVALECLALELAVPNMIHADLQRAEDILRSYTHQTEAKAWSAHNIAFHQCIYEPCHNDHLLRMISEIRSRLGVYSNTIVSEASGIDRPHQEHLAILAACKEGDAQKAKDLMRDHILTTKKVATAYLRRRPAH
ncbi:GntR family transcriptional regulator [Cognatishimia sp. SS12]|uniref:GntR family transcriptional regulator n=1 Tax=Cognatishimia sp. SS12 TaxID=2979465 RepID=UPI00232BACCD|nr:GntR family transcriptional regulator [Cognatishimia sp. SS12]MDC0737992.1 GntR family transcriptional regulator [Cognatishimia sp. SS12]